MNRLRTPLAAALVALSVTSFAQNPSVETLPPGLLTVSGTADAKVESDMATVRFGIEAQAKTAKDAQASASATANRILTAALKVVSDRKAYKTTDLTLEPVYSQPPAPTGLGGGAAPQEPKIVGYRARNVLLVRIDDVTQVGPLVDAVTDAGATNVEGISFGLKDSKATRQQALSEAVRDARFKAEVMAAALGMKLGEVYSIEEGSSGVRTYESQLYMAARVAAAPVMPGQVSVGANVTIRFRLVK